MMQDFQLNIVWLYAILIIGDSPHQAHMGGCQIYGPFLGILNIRVAF